MTKVERELQEIAVKKVVDKLIDVTDTVVGSEIETTHGWVIAERELRVKFTEIVKRLIKNGR